MPAGSADSKGTVRKPQAHWRRPVGGGELQAGDDVYEVHLIPLCTGNQGRQERRL